MTQLIALVEDAADVTTALAGGIRRVAVRFAPLATFDGPELARLAAIGAAARERCAVSLWCSGPLPDLAAAMSACGADEIWAPVAAEQPSGVPHWVVASAAGEAEVGDAPNCAGLVISGGEGPPRLLESVAMDQLHVKVRDAQLRGVPVRIAGSMEAPDVPRLQALRPEALVGDDLLRSDGALHAGKVRLATDLLQSVDHGPQAAAAACLPSEPDRIFVRDWTVPLHVGAYGHEQAPQRVRFGVEAEVERVAERAADMRDVVTYDLITDAIARATVTHVALVETIAEDMAALILAHPRVTAVDITVEKLDLGPGSLGCRIRRRRARS